MLSQSASCQMSQAYDDIVFEAGWTRYTKVKGKWVTESGSPSSRKAYTFDTETFVTSGSIPGHRHST